MIGFLQISLFDIVNLPSIIPIILRSHQVIFPLFCTIGLFTTLVLMFLLPILSKKIGRNMEPFFLLMGIISLTISQF
ncbi:MAG: DUF1646 domain-containing protein [Candidatus Methanoliparum thermophilum]|uniref:DUF1646 domain-containing protein n=1 Tax=Methanoliparum thermophilum TaxID=2491083 RepID=A0A520KQI9_METT2|nr:MAG: DUF1646 domain-containing protein [Candidatus Methanoliparum thermophilum]